MPQILAGVILNKLFAKIFTFCEDFGLTLQSGKMKIRLIKRKTIDKYIIDNARSRSSFREWLSNLDDACWETPDDIVSLFNHADLLGNGSNRVVFNVGGNNYRVICKYWFGTTKVHLYVKWIGSHAEYDKLCDSGKQYSINNY